MKQLYFTLHYCETFIYRSLQIETDAMWSRLLHSRVWFRSSYLKLFLLNLLSVQHIQRERSRRQPVPPSSWCIHYQNMLFWDPHGRSLLAWVLNNQLLPGLPAAACGATETCPGNLVGPSRGDEGAVWLPRLSVRRFVWMLGARSGDSVRAIPLTVMWLSRQPRPAPFFTRHPSLSPCVPTHPSLHNSSPWVSNHLKQRWLLYLSTS